MQGRRSSRTYAVRAGAEHWAFVPHPEVSGWWFRVHPAVLVVGCMYPGCGALPGQPCKGKDGYGSWTHQSRRTAAKDGVAKLEYVLGIVANIEQPRRRA